MQYTTYLPRVERRHPSTSAATRNISCSGLKSKNWSHRFTPDIAGFTSIYGAGISSVVWRRFPQNEIVYALSGTIYDERATDEFGAGTIG